MPVHNRFFLSQDAQGKAQFHPSPLHQQGPVLSVEVHIPSALATLLGQQNQPPPPPVTGLALIDTGATNSCVDRKVIQSLGVSPIGIIETGTAGGKVKQHLFPAKLNFPGEGFTAEFNATVGVDLSGQVAAGQNIIALIGRDLLTRWLLIYNGPAGLFTIAF